MLSRFRLSFWFCSCAEGDEIAARVAVSATGYADAMTTDVVWFSYQLD